MYKLMCVCAISSQILFANCDEAVFIRVSRVVRICLAFCFTSLSDCFKNLAPLSQPIRSKTKTNHDSLTHRFSRASCQLHVLALSFDWFIGLSVSFVIGQSDYFGFGLTTLNRKSL